MDIPIVRWTDPGSGEIKENMVFCTDILDALTQDFFARKGNPIDEPPHVDEIKVNLQLIYFRNFAFLYHFIKEFEKKNSTWLCHLEGMCKLHFTVTRIFPLRNGNSPITDPIAKMEVAHTFGPW